MCVGVQACVVVRACGCVGVCVWVCVIPFLLIGPVTPFHLGSPLYRSYGQDQNNKICFRDKLDKVAADARGLCL